MNECSKQTSTQSRFQEHNACIRIKCSLQIHKGFNGKKNNDSKQQCSHGSATSEKNLLEIKRILTKILFVWLKICAQSPGFGFGNLVTIWAELQQMLFFQQNTILIHWIFCQHSKCKYKVCKVCPWWVAVFCIYMCHYYLRWVFKAFFCYKVPFRTIQRVWRINIVQTCFSWEPK